MLQRCCAGQRDGKQDSIPIDALFLLIGAEPHTPACEHGPCDSKGFVITGRDPRRPHTARTASQREPLRMRQLPGVFAIGESATIGEARASPSAKVRRVRYVS